MTARLLAVPLALALMMAAAPPEARAHPLAPALLKIELGADPTAGGAHAIVLRWPTDARAPRVLADGCAVTPLAVAVEGEAHVRRERWVCGAGATVRLVADPSEPPVVVELEGPAGNRSAVLDAAHPTAALDVDGAIGETIVRWLGLGVDHLLSGPDHLLLVLGLCALIGFRRRLAVAVTAFTLGHSLSLALAATGVVTLPSAVVEVAIAATLVLLGLELATAATRPPGSRGVIARWPWLGGTAVGLVHGLGFAGGLRALGLPDAGVAPALVGFNLGLEVAQLGFIAALGLATLGLRAAAPRRLRATLTAARVVTAAGWLVGVAGAAWLLDRALP